MTAGVLPGWAGFYTMTGSASATLIGLVFIVITLGAQISKDGAGDAIHAFVTPSLIHFAGALLDSLLMLIPWSSPRPLGVVLIAFGFGGLLYVLFTLRLMREVGAVKLTPSDWLAYSGAPALAGAATASGGFGLMEGWPNSALCIALGMLLLLFAAIYQAWDLTLWIVRNRKSFSESSR